MKIFPNKYIFKKADLKDEKHYKKRYEENYALLITDGNPN